MKVLMVSKALVVASYRSKLREIAALGVELTAVVPPRWREAGKALPFEEADDTGYRIIKSPIRFNGHFHVHFYPQLDSVIRDVRPDIVHMDEEAYNLATFLGVRSAGRHAASSIFFTWQNINRPYPPPFRNFEQYVYKRSAYALAGNRDAFEILRAKGYAGPAGIIPQFGVDTDCFQPAGGLHEERPFTIGYLGRLVPEKGIGDLTAAVRALDSPAKLIVAGDGPLATAVEADLAETRSQGRFERLERVPSSQVPALLHRLDVLVLPSRTATNWREQYGRVLIEAMASGVPVIGSDSGEIPNVIGDAGIVFPEGDCDALTKALVELASSDKLRRELAERGRVRAVEHFSQRQIAQRTLNVYRQVVDGRATR